MKRVLVLGLARSGRAAKQMLEANGVEVVAADRTLGNDTDLALLDGVDVLVKSPGVPGEAPLVVGARERGVPVWSEVELASRFLERPIIGVTGTNGKTTTTELLGAMLAAPTAGNVGRALSELHDVDVEPGTPVVCELSSFQLEDVDTSGRRSLSSSISSPTISTGMAPSTPTGLRSCGSSRTRRRRTSRSCRAASARSPARVVASSSPRTTTCPPSR